MNDGRIIFLGGLHRSGTSLLFRILRDHPAVSGFRDTGVAEDEGQLLQSVYPPAREFGGPGRFGFEPRAFLDETSPLASADNAAKLFAEWSRYWDLSRERLLEKSPPNLVRSRFLQALYPGSSFVMLMRHPVAVSIATRKWSRNPLGELIEHWVLCHERFAADRPHVEKLAAIKYEHLVRSSEPVMNGVYEFLGLAPAALQQEVNPNVNERYFRRWRELRERRAGDLREMEERFEARVRAFGYSLEDLDYIGE